MRNIIIFGKNVLFFTGTINKYKRQKYIFFLSNLVLLLQASY